MPPMRRERTGPSERQLIEAMASLGARKRGGSRRPNPPEYPPGPYLFHVTVAASLPSIAASGLRSGGGEGLGQQYRGHTDRGVFFTEREGVGFWMSRTEQWAEHRSDDPFGEELVPVVLRTLADFEVERDDPGTRDAAAGCWIGPAVKAEDLELWDGDAWVPVDEYEGLDLSSAFTFGEEPRDEEDDDGEGEGDESGGDGWEDEPRMLAWFKSPSTFEPPAEALDED
jgi:hypothetical protein